MDEVLRRFFEASGCTTQAELAAFLGIRQPSVAEAKRQRTIPAAWLLTLLRRKAIHPDWVLTGKGPRFLLPVDTPDSPYLNLPAFDAAHALTRLSTKDLAAELLRRVSQD